jgi:hypothetical protein
MAPSHLRTKHRLKFSWRRKLAVEFLEARRLLASAWQNPVTAEDVDDSGFIALNDLQLVVQDLRTNGSPHELIARPLGGPAPYVDVTGDNRVTIVDLLAIVTPLRAGLGLATPSIAVALANDTGEPNDEVTSDPISSGRITSGLTSDTRLVAHINGESLFSVRLDASGEFSFDPGVSLPNGMHTVRLFAQNLGGPVGQTQISFTLDAVSEAVTWDQATLEAIRRDASTPPVASRALAMASLAVHDALAALAGSPPYAVALTAPAGASSVAAVAAAAHGVLSYLFPAQQAVLDAQLAESLGRVFDGSRESEGQSLGRSAAEAIIALREGDGWDTFLAYTPGAEPGQWQPTTPMFDVALLPQWATLEPFAMTTPNQFRPAGPPALGNVTYTDAFNEVKQLGAVIGSSRTTEQTEIARFWADGPGTYTPPGHWNHIAIDLAREQGRSLTANSRLFLKLNLALADAAILAWDAKFAHNFWRPVTAIREADRDDNDYTTADPVWSPLLITPPFPEYVSGHSTFSGAAAAILTSQLGEGVPFSTTSPGLPGVTRSFESFDEAAEEAGRSRILGGIHYEFSNRDGLAAGRALADFVVDRFSATEDVRPPRIILNVPHSSLATAQAFDLIGWALDDLTGVVSLEFQLDNAVYTAASFDSAGRFTIPVSLPVDGSADGDHLVRLRATDAAGNVSSPIEFSFTLDTVAPMIVVTSPTDDGALEADAVLNGTLSREGSAIVSLNYAFNNGPTTPIPFSAEAAVFSIPLNLSKLTAGAHLLTVTASDKAGNTASQTLSLQLAQAIPLTVTEHSPNRSAVDVGSTFKPKIAFSRPVDPASLNANNFFATNAAGDKLPANIVPAHDGSFAWLFFQQPLPGGARITLHVDGATIQAASDNALLDADGDGLPGGRLETSFTTVSLTPLLGTTLTGRVFDPGPDLKPMTFDDFRAGPDGALFTSDDVFLRPIAGVKVFIVGLENQGVFTDAQGSFHLDAVPAGNAKLAIDGQTATNAPDGVYFPEMVMDLNLEAGRDNTVMGTMGSLEERTANRDRQEVYLPRLATSLLGNVSGAGPTMIGVDAQSAPNLTPQQRAMLSIEVQPGSLLDANGNPLASGQVGINTVPPELVREMLPPGVLQHTFDITVQSPGITNFAAPAPMTFPNVFDAPPGAQLNFLSFDHTTGRLVIEGSATVSADGLSVRTDPGAGITHPGWHGLTPQGSDSGPEPPELPEPPQACEATGARQDLGTTAAAASSQLFSFTRTSFLGTEITHTDDFLFTTQSQFGRLEFSNLQVQNPCLRDQGELLIDVTVDANSAGQFLNGIRRETFYLRPGKSMRRDFLLKNFSEAELSKMFSDRLYGVRVQVEARVNDGRGNYTLLPDNPAPFYVYAYLDNTDDKFDGRLAFPDTLASGAVTRTRRVLYFGDPEATPQLFTTEGEFGLAELAPGEWLLQFQPESAADFASSLAIDTPEGRSPGEGAVPMVGSGTSPIKVNLNRAGFELALQDLADDVANQEIIIDFVDDHTHPLYSLIYRGKSTSDFTSLNVSSTEEEVVSALEKLDDIGSGNVSVRIAREVRGLAPNGLENVRLRMQVFREGGLFLYAKDLVTIREPQLQNRLTASVQRHVDPSRGLTGNELRLIDNLNEAGDVDPNERAAFVDDVLNAVGGAFTALSPEPGIQSGDDGSAFEIRWGTGGSGVVGEADVTHYDDYGTLLFDLKSILTNRKKENLARTAFKLAQRLSKYQIEVPTHLSRVFIDKIFTSRYDLPFDASRSDLIQAIAQVAVHELGHELGLFHVAGATVQKTANEVQTLSLSGGVPSDEYRLEFAGDYTELIRRDAPAGLVEARLQDLAAMGGSLTVTGPDGGPYVVSFVSTTAGVDAFFRGVDVPQISQFRLPEETTPITVQTSTSTQGAHVLQIGREVKLRGQHGSNDLMSQGRIGAPKSFLSSISLPLLRMALRKDWTSSDVEAALGVIAQASVLHLSASNQTDSFDGDLTDPPRDDDPVIELGPALALLTAAGELNQSQLDLGTVAVSASGSASATLGLDLLNYGSQDVVIRSIVVTQGADQFSIPPFAVTTLRPGDTMQLNVTFSPKLNGAARGVLSIDTNVPGFNGQFDLLGLGVPADAPDIHFEYFSNNLLGAEIGRLKGFTNKPLIVNQGARPLTVTEIRTAAGQGQDEYFAESVLPLPVTLQPGESFAFNILFRPSKAGLRPGAFEIVSDDPETPILRQPFTGTGVVTPDNFVTFDGVDIGNDFVAVEDTDKFTINLPTLRTRTDNGGNWQFFLPGQRHMHVATFDPVSGLIAHGFGLTSASGQRTNFNIGAFQPSVWDDSDGDGLPDDIEFAIGTSPNQIDTDGDGQNDFAEIDGGQNPLDGRPSVTGIVSALETDGEALDVQIAADFADPSRKLAYLAVREAGIAIVDVTDFARPTLIGQYDSSETNESDMGIFAISLDAVHQVLAAATPRGGVHLIDVADPTQPSLLLTIPHNGNDPVVGVEVFDGQVLVAVGDEIRTFDETTGEPYGTLELGGLQVLGMARRDYQLFITSEDLSAPARFLQLVDITATGLITRGSVTLPLVTISDPFVAGDIVWIPSGDRVMTVDVQQPDAPRLIQAEQRLGVAVNAISLNGSGLGIIPAGDSRNPSALVLETDDAREIRQVFAQFTLPSYGHAVGLSSGLAYLATGDSGLQILNFLAFDQGSTPPFVVLGPIVGDIDPGRVGLQMVEATTVVVPAEITDDVQARSVELLVDGAVVRTELSYPYDLSTVLPKVADTGTEVVLQIRATDTGGNVRLSDPIVIELAPDVTPPTIAELDPPDGATEPVSRRRISIQFSEPVDRAAAEPNHFVLRGPGGDVTPLSLHLRQRDTRVEIFYPPLVEGEYQFIIHAADVADRIGNPLAADDLISTFRVGSVTREPTIRWVNEAGGAWNLATNWLDVATQMPRLPTASDDVLIDVPTDALVTFEGGVVHVNSILANERFQVTGGTLAATETIQVNNTFVLRGPDLQNVATLSGTVLRGSRGETLTIGGDSRLDGATIQADITINEANTRLRVQNGLALLGTATIAANNVAIGFEGTQTILAGTFTTGQADDNLANLRLTAIGAATVTLGAEVTIRGAGNLGNSASAFQVAESVLHVINYGTISSGGAQLNSFSTSSESLINHGLIANSAKTLLLLNDRSWTNAADGRILLDGNHSQFDSLIQVSLLGGTWSNAGVIELNDVWAEFMRNPGSVWSNTGTLVLNESQLSLQGSFTSDDVRNLRNLSSRISIKGTMDNTGRTLTFTSDTGSSTLSQNGRIQGGTIESTGPNSRLELDALAGTLDGVTLVGDVFMGGVRRNLQGTNILTTSRVNIINGLVLDGSITMYDSSDNLLEFIGPQSLSGGTIKFLDDPDVIGFGTPPSLQARQGGPVVIDSSVTIHGGLGRIGGNIISYAAINAVADAIQLHGVDHTNPQIAGPFVNRGTINIPVGANIRLGWPFINEGQIVVNHGTVFADLVNVAQSSVGFWKNAGVIDLTNQGRLNFTQNSGAGQRPRLRTVDMGTILDSGGFVSLQSNMLLDNTGSILVIDDTADWTLSNATVEGGIIEVANTARLHSAGGVLKDVRLLGNLGISPFASLWLVGDITVDGTIAPESPNGSIGLFLGDSSRYPNIPTILRSGIIDVRSTITGPAYSVTIEPGVVLRGRNAQATFSGPLLNRGEIVADTTNSFVSGEVFAFTAAPVTNEGTLSAVNRSVLRIANLAAPNAGTIAAASGGTVNFTGNFAQAAAGQISLTIGGTANSQFGRVTTTSSASLDGALHVNFAAGFTPAAGDRFQVLDYASRIGDFSSIHVANLPAYLVITPEYNATNLTLVVSAALHAAEEPDDVRPEVGVTAAAFDAVFRAAVARWAGTGLSDTALAVLRAADIRVEGLPAGVLAVATGNVIRLDDDAAGFDWYIDTTPNDDIQFDDLLAADRLFGTSWQFEGHMDMLTAVMHELGHLRIADIDDPNSTSLMSHRLTAGSRRLPRR